MAPDDVPTVRFLDRLGVAARWATETDLHPFVGGLLGRSQLRLGAEQTECSREQPTQGATARPGMSEGLGDLIKPFGIHG